jgi:Xaa-Pro aminopeptidase
MARLIETRIPDFGRAAEPPQWRLGRDGYRARLDRVRERMERHGWTHLIVYGDREHFANLVWLAGFDPRFEEALLIVGLKGDPLMLAGNECVNYLPATPAPMRVERFQWLSPPTMPNSDSRALAGILRDEGIDAHSRVGFAGWKPYGDPRQIDAPSYMVDAVRFAAGWENVENAAGVFVDPDDGLRTAAAAEEIVFFEWTGTLASDGMRRVVEAVEPGALDHDLLKRVEYNGAPLGCHTTLKCGGNRVSLASARGERVVRGGRFSCGICYWGANCCRAGWVAEGPADLPDVARGYVEAFAGPYMDAMAAWFERLRIGAPGGELHDAIHSRLDDGLFHVFLNAGHLIGFDEWISSPVWAGSAVRLRPGMVMQADVIPSHPDYYSSRMEDGYALADAALRAEIERLSPGCAARCDARREWMRQTLGLPVDDEVMPLTNLPGAVFPYLLNTSLLLKAG